MTGVRLPCLVRSGPRSTVISWLHLNRTERIRVRFSLSPLSVFHMGDNVDVCGIGNFPCSTSLKGPSGRKAPGTTEPRAHGGRRRGGGKNENQGKFTGTYVVIGRFEMNRCEAVSRDEVIF